MKLPFGKRKQIVRKHARREMMWVIQGGGWIGVCKSVDPLWLINQIHPYSNFRPESEIRAKIFVLHAKSKIRAQEIDDAAFRCSCRIQKSVNISLWIRDPGKNIFKIRWSVRLFTPLFKRGGFRYLCLNGVNLSSFVGFESSENWTRMTGAWLWGVLGCPLTPLGRPSFEQTTYNI